MFAVFNSSKEKSIIKVFLKENEIQLFRAIFI